MSIDMWRSIGRLGEDRDAARAGELLGHEAELARLLMRRSRCRLQVGAMCAVWVTAVFAAVGEASWAVPLMLACVPVSLVVAFALLAVEAELRSEVLSSIASGHARLPLRVVRDEVRRLNSPDTRTALARAFTKPGRPPKSDGRVPDLAYVVADPRMIEQVRPELDRVATIIASGRSSVEGLAAAAWMMSGPSAILDQDADQFRRELNRIAFLLQCTPTASR
jgi:hypothetical protein